MICFRIDTNDGTVNTNDGYVQLNTESGTVTWNEQGGAVATNYGTITTNDGTVETNAEYGTIDTNDSCICKEQWSIDDYENCGVTQNGCEPTACDGDTAPWCNIKNPGCDDEVDGEGWAYCDPI